jgi:MFS family permease
MTIATCSAASAPNVAASHTLRLSPKAAFYLLASITVTFLAGSLAPTPLYPIYQAKWGFSALTLTTIFSIYALALLGALLVAGRVSDHVGRRPVLIVATIAQALTMLLFVEANGPNGLLLARFVQGLATGAAIGAIGAGMIDLNKTLGPVANAIAPMTGTATGAVIAGLMVHFLPAPTSLVYLTLAVIYLAQMLGVVLMAETIVRRPGALASLRLQIGLPAAVSQPMLLATPVLIAAWSFAGFYASLGPAITRVVFGLDPSLGGGTTAFAFAGSAALTVSLTQQRAPRAVMTYGAFALLTGSIISVLSLASHTTTVFLVGTVLAGTGFGAGFQGAVRTVAPIAQPHERAGVLSVIFVVSYVAMGLPAVTAGLFVARGVNLLLTAQLFGGFVAMLAALALFGAVLNSRRLV